MHIDIIKAYLKAAKEAERSWFGSHADAHSQEAFNSYGLIYMQYRELREMLERLVILRESPAPVEAAGAEETSS
jgi:hypothetical protein